MGSIDLALWDTNTRRAISLKDRLDMFAGDFGTTMIPTVPTVPMRQHDAVFLSFDECDEPVIRVARAVRRTSEITFILLVNDRTQDISPLFRPKIRPSGVIFRPVQNTQIREMLDEITSELDRLMKYETEDLFIFKAEGKVRRIPFRNILFFEASYKKVLIHTNGQEIAYYDSIENLTASLPQHFMRCHRSYIVNTQMIKELYGAEKELKLIGGQRIPFSRSYSSTVKQIVSGFVPDKGE
jgi:DNA-binding LytR/AlgR family response regulator